jgi:hypothetical protein
MPDRKKFRKHPLSDILSGAEVDPSIRHHCEALAASRNLLSQVAAVGFLLDGQCIGSAKQRGGVEYRAGLWVDAMSDALVRDVERLALLEVDRQIRNLQGVDLSTLDPIERDVLRNQRKIIEAVNAVLLRAKRHHVDRQLAELDDVLPPGY